ncbi:larval cuticle protein LCP-17 precursor [Bombyx mori]|uniref:Larval cuticle protein LCP-17 n=2 Tax=Bombyx mori TaxID=7091 RepID=CU17_BOMMO|nr:larval cuticle protein LCP-17 precursor [Bombyx mori]O02387.1 RecName: Full=Larval cuticle protein LCP-17; Flags: Precursor [Bombyx mori]AHF55751.1 RR1-type cuticular protein [Bombyx mori]BAA20474.1 LCP17 [Bombyx mori]
MKFLIVLAVAVACASADVSHIAKSDEYAAPVVKSSYDITPEGHFQFNYETGNGIYAQAEGAVKNVNSEYPAIEVKGAYKYTSPDGQPIDLAYVADENGYQPQGSHLPTPHPIPEAIARALAYIEAHPPSPSVVERKVVANLLG